MNKFIISIVYFLAVWNLATSNLDQNACERCGGKYCPTNELCYKKLGEATYGPAACLICEEFNEEDIIQEGDYDSFCFKDYLKQGERLLWDNRGCSKTSKGRCRATELLPDGTVNKYAEAIEKCRVRTAAPVFCRISIKTCKKIFKAKTKKKAAAPFKAFNVASFAFGRSNNNNNKFRAVKKASFEFDDKNLCELMDGVYCAKSKKCFMNIGQTSAGITANAMCIGEEMKGLWYPTAADIKCINSVPDHELFSGGMVWNSDSMPLDVNSDCQATELSENAPFTFISDSMNVNQCTTTNQLYDVVCELSLEKRRR